ncbi:hypothetical protein, partial [uncultured Dubosiella sp.]
KAYLKFEKKDKEYNRQLETMTKQLEEKEQQLNKKEKEWSKERNSMLSQFVVSAQRLMAKQGLTAEQACDLLGYDEDLRATVLPYLVS